MPCGCNRPVNLCLSRGFTRTVRVAIVQNGSPVDLTGWIAKLQIRKADGTEVKTLTVGQGITIAGNTITAQILVTAADTLIPDGRDYLWALAIVPDDRPAGDPIEGYCTVTTPPVLL